MKIQAKKKVMFTNDKISPFVANKNMQLNKLQLKTKRGGHWFNLIIVALFILIVKLPSSLVFQCFFFSFMMIVDMI